MIIDNIYIKETKRILGNFNFLLNEIKQYETTLSEKKESMESMLKDLGDISRSDKNDLYKEQKTYELIDRYNLEIGKIEKTISPILEKIELTKKEISILYTTIKEKYSEYNEEEIKNQIQIQLAEQ